MPKLSQIEIDKFLAERNHLARIATVRADGAPTVVPVWFIYERGHVSAGEILRFGLWMTAVAYLVILLVAVPYWALTGEPLARTGTPAIGGRP